MKQIVKYLSISLAVSTISIATYHFTIANKIKQITINTDALTNAREASFLQPSDQLSSDFNIAAENTIHAVVHIMTEFTRKSSVYDNYFSIEDFFYNGRSRVYKATGSGVIISSDGYIVTNNHVVQQADKITITLNDKRTYIAKVVGLDPQTDLALLKIEANELPFLTYGNSDKLKIGEWVLAVGNPFNLTSTVTAGIVSAKARDINILGSNTSIESFIQTDAAVNPGNSGGALVDIRGELVGINAAIASGTGYYTGYSFAIPVSIVKKVVKDLKDFGKVQRAILGVSIEEVNSEVAEKFGLEKIEGVLVEGVVSGLAADNAGITAGDIILEIDEQKVNSRSELLEKIGNYSPGDKVKVKFIHNSKVKEETMKLTSMNGGTEIMKESDVASTSLGAEFEMASSKTLKDLKILNGVRVKNIGEGLMAKAGIKEDFIITKIDQKTISKPEDITQIINNKKGGILIEGIYPNGIKAYYGIGL